MNKTTIIEHDGTDNNHNINQPINNKQAQTMITRTSSKSDASHARRPDPEVPEAALGQDGLPPLTGEAGRSGAGGGGTKKPGTCVKYYYYYYYYYY